MTRAGLPTARRPGALVRRLWTGRIHYIAWSTRAGGQSYVRFNPNPGLSLKLPGLPRLHWCTKCGWKPLTGP